MAIDIPAPPVFTDPTETTTDTTAHSEAWAMVNAKYHDAGVWAAWAAGVMNSSLTNLSATLGSSAVDDDLAAIQDEIGDIPAYSPGAISGGNGTFSDDLLTSLKSRLAADIATASTGLGNAETAMFARETARVQAANAKAYSEATTFYSSKGWDQPPGALGARTAQMSAEAAQNLADSSGKILEESARLAVQYNLGVISASSQLIDILSKVFDSKEARTFEASKATVMLAAETYRNSLSLVGTKADIALKKGDITITAHARQLALEVESMRAVALGFQQIAASAMNSFNASTAFGFSGSASTSYVGT